MVQAQLGIHLLQSPVLFFQSLELLHLKRLHATVLTLPVVVGRLRNLILAAAFLHLAAGFDLLQHLDDLRLSKSGLSSRSPFGQFTQENSSSEWDCPKGGGLHHVIELDFIQPGKPTQNSYIERFNRTYRDEILNMYAFKTLNEVREMNERWIKEYNEERPHDFLEDLTPIEFLKKYEPAGNIQLDVKLKGGGLH